MAHEFEEMLEKTSEYEGRHVTIVFDKYSPIRYKLPTVDS